MVTGKNKDVFKAGDAVFCPTNGKGIVSTVYKSTRAHERGVVVVLFFGKSFVEYYGGDTKNLLILATNNEEDKKTKCCKCCHDDYEPNLGQGGLL